MAFDQAVVAIGQMGPFADTDQLKKTDPASGIQISRQGCLTVDDQGWTRVEGLYAAGDGVTGPTTVVQSMASGRSAARSIHVALSQEEMPIEKTGRPTDRDYPEIPKNIPSLSRPTMPEQQPGVRKDNFSEVAMGVK